MLSYIFLKLSSTIYILFYFKKYLNLLKQFLVFFLFCFKLQFSFN